MENFLNELTASGFDPGTFLMAAMIFAVGSLVISFIGKMIFGKDSGLSNAISSAIGILFIYVATVAVMTLGGELEQFRPFLSPLPFVSIEEEVLRIFPIQTAAHTEICSQILSMVILAFLVNLLDTLLPRGKHIVTWFILRCATVVLAILAHWAVTGLITSFLPDIIVEYAPTILLGLLVLMLAVGALKFVVGAAIAVVNPIIGALYTFFFANIIGKEVSKALLSTALLTGLVWALNEFGVVALSVSAAALMAYVPFLVILAVVWYIVNQIL
jgi:hypothetical protein